MVTLDEMKKYLRVDYDDDDSLITSLIDDANSRIMNILRIDSNVSDSDISNYNLAIMYTVAFLYEHREETDYKELNLTLRALLFNDREVEF